MKENAFALQWISVMITSEQINLITINGWDVLVNEFPRQKWIPNDVEGNVRQTIEVSFVHTELLHSSYVINWHSQTTHFLR